MEGPLWCHRFHVPVVLCSAMQAAIGLAGLIGWWVSVENRKDWMTMEGPLCLMIPIALGVLFCIFLGMCQAL